jgi:hypothetical protein
VAEPRYTLSKQDVRTLKGVVRKVSAGKVSQRPLPTRRRTRNTKGGTVNIIHGLAVGAVSGGSTFNIDNIEVRNGVDPREDPEDAAEAVEVLNPFGWHIDDNGLVRAEQADDGTWDAVQAACPA